MTVRLVDLSYPPLAHFLYADRRPVRRDGGFERPVKGIYFASKEDTPRVLRDEMIFFADDLLVVVAMPTVGCDLTLFEPEEYLEEISEARGIKLVKNLIRPLRKLSPAEFCTFVQMSCVLKRWYREAFTSKEKVYTLFESLMKSKKDFLETYFTLREHLSASELFSSILTFLSRVDLYEDQKDSLSKFYRKIVRKGKGQSMTIPRAAMRLLRTSDEVSLDARILQFCFDLRG